MKNNFFCKNQFTNIYKKTSELSKITSQILYGEKFEILTKSKKWIKIRSSYDNYIGYIKNEKYIDKYKPTHKVYNLKAGIFDKSKNKTKNFLPFGARFLIINENKKFIEFEKNKWLKKIDIKKINHKEKNFVKILKLFLQTKYVWGGKTFNGIDCSALLQLFYYYNNSIFPRDTKEQIK